MINSLDHSGALQLKKFEDFINLTTHELKTPLTLLKAYLQMVTLQLRRDDQQDYLKNVEKMDVQLNKLLHLISDLQDGFKANAEEMHCLMNEVAVNDFLTLCATDAEAAHPEFYIEMQLDKSHPYIKADKERIEQVVHNLINNAIKYSDEIKYIKICSKVSGRKVIVSITDKGIGIPAEQQTNIFDQFYRVRDLQGEQPAGQGLGLFICSEIIRKHCGQIWVSSEEGVGSTLYFSLPLST